MITDSWLQDTSKNRLKNSYLQGFLDISGNIILRNGSMNITNGDISLNGNLSVFSDITINNLKYDSISQTVPALDLSDNFAENFIPVSTSFATKYIATSANGQYILIANVSTVYLSANYGYNYHLKYTTTNITSIAISSDGEYQTLLTETGSYYSSDFGISWTASSGLPGSGNSKNTMSGSGKYQTVITTGSSLYISSNYGITFSAFTAPASNLNDIAVSASGKYQISIKWTSTSSISFYLSSDYGITWRTVFTTTPSSQSFGYTNNRVAISATGQYQAVGVVFNGIYISRDYGSTWSTVYNTGLGGSSQFTGIYMTADGKNILANNSGEFAINFYKSVDYGVNWTNKIITKTTSTPPNTICGSANGQYIYLSKNGQSYYYLVTTPFKDNVFTDSSFQYLTDISINKVSSSIGMNIGRHSASVTNTMLTTTTSGISPFYTGTHNTHMGLISNTYTTGSFNITFGSLSGYTSTTSTSNSTSIGVNTGVGTNAIKLGNQLFGSINANTNSITIGYNTISTSIPANYITLGNSSITTVDTSGSISSDGFVKNKDGYIANSWWNQTGFPTQNTIDVSSITGIKSRTSNQLTKYIGGVLCPTGRIYFMTHTAGLICSINTANDTLDASFNYANTATTRQFGCVLAPNGRVFSIPYDEQTTYYIDSILTPTTLSTGVGGITGGNKFRGGVLGPDGKIYCVPYDASDIMIIDPSPSTPTINRTTLSGASNVGINGNKYAGGALAPNGKIYFAPSTVSTIGYVDASASIPTCASFNITTPTGSSPYYSGCVLAPNGKIYCIPYSSTTVGVIDPATNGFSQPITGITGTNKFSGGVLAPNGKIYCIPFNATDVMIIDPSANTVDRTSISLTGVVPSLSTKFQGGVLAPNGKIYCVPYAADYVLIINTGLPTNPSWMLAPEFNKF